MELEQRYVADDIVLLDIDYYRITRGENGELIGRTPSDEANAEVGKAIESIKAEEYPNWELSAYNEKLGKFIQACAFDDSSHKDAFVSALEGCEFVKVLDDVAEADKFANEFSRRWLEAEIGRIDAENAILARIADDQKSSNCFAEVITCGDNETDNRIMFQRHGQKVIDCIIGKFADCGVDELEARKMFVYSAMRDKDACTLTIVWGIKDSAIASKVYADVSRKSFDEECDVEAVEMFDPENEEKSVIRMTAVKVLDKLFPSEPCKVEDCKDESNEE